MDIIIIILMFEILKKILCCCINDSKKLSTSNTYNMDYSSITPDTCECNLKGPTAWGTCNVCGAWKNY
jgi:hypothetical protein